MFLSWQLTNRLVDEVYYTFTGQHTYDYKFQIGASPLSETWEFASGLVLYLVVVFGLREYVKSTKAMPLKGPFAVHNLLLTIASLVLLLLIGEVMIPLVLEHGFFWSFCSHASFHESGLQFAYYLNYLSKYWELIDTVFLVLQKKPLRFLHVYHHSLTMVLCIAQLRGEVALVRNLELFTGRSNQNPIAVSNGSRSSSTSLSMSSWYADPSSLHFLNMNKKKFFFLKFLPVLLLFPLRHRGQKDLVEEACHDKSDCPVCD